MKIFASLALAADCWNVLTATRSPKLRGPGQRRHRGAPDCPYGYYDALLWCASANYGFGLVTGALHWRRPWFHGPDNFAPLNNRLHPKHGYRARRRNVARGRALKTCR